MSKHDYRLAEIVATLAKHGQRATYGAVGGLVGLPARSVMSGQPKTPENSFVVSKSTKMPTGYRPGETHPNLELRATVIARPEDLASWLQATS